MGPAAHPLASDPTKPNPIDDGTWHATIQDLRFDVRYNVTRNLWNTGIVLTPFVGSVMPSHEYPYFVHAGFGRNLQEIQAGVSVAKLFERGIPGLVLQGRYAYGFVEEVIDISHNRSLGSLEAAYFITSSLRAFGMIGGQRTHGGIDLSPRSRLELPPSVFRYHDQIHRENMLTVAGGTSYSLNDTVDLFGSLTTTVAQRNGHELQRGISIGLSWSFTTRRAQPRAVTTTAENSLVRCLCEKGTEQGPMRVACALPLLAVLTAGLGPFSFPCSELPGEIGPKCSRCLPVWPYAEMRTALAPRGQQPPNAPELVAQVRAAMATGGLIAGERTLNTYRAVHGATPEAVDALVWLARGALSAQLFDKASQYAGQSRDLALAALETRPGNEQLQKSIGASLEVLALALVAQGARLGRGAPTSRRTRHVSVHAGRRGSPESPRPREPRRTARPASRAGCINRVPLGHQGARWTTGPHLLLGPLVRRVQSGKPDAREAPQQVPARRGSPSSRPPEDTAMRREAGRQLPTKSSGTSSRRVTLLTSS